MWGLTPWPHHWAERPLLLCRFPGGALSVVPVREGTLSAGWATSLPVSGRYTPEWRGKSHSGSTSPLPGTGATLLTAPPVTGGVCAVAAATGVQRRSQMSAVGGGVVMKNQPVVRCPVPPSARCGVRPLGSDASWRTRRALTHQRPKANQARGRTMGDRGGTDCDSGTWWRRGRVQTHA